jgi:hypothetical protein
MMATIRLQRELHPGMKQTACWFLAWLILRPSKWRYAPPKRRMAFNELNGVIFQNLRLFITTAVRSQNPTISLVTSLYFAALPLRLARATKRREVR